VTSDPSAEDLSLAAEFPAATREDWLKLVASALKGAPFDQKLVSRTYDGLRIEPLYGRAADAAPVAARALAAPWQVMARVDHPNPLSANAEARHELENGATGLSPVFAGAAGSHGYGLEASESALGRALDGIHLDAGISLELDLGPGATDVARVLADLAGSTGGAPEKMAIRFGLDPIGALAVTGSNPSPWDETEAALCKLVTEVSSRGFTGPFITADARPIHDAGGSGAQELAFALACAAAYLRALEAHGVALEQARGMIFFRLAADADQFLSIAKLRALRLLWARVEAACGMTPKPVFVSAQTAWRMMTKRDPWVNLLRSTVATFAAGIGGADAITVLAFTNALGLPDRFARRLARNTQLILLEEANLSRVMDPAVGSGAIEDLTAKLCRAAWTLFQEIESAGGVLAALKAGLIQRKVAAVRSERGAAVAARRDPLTGTSAFPDIAELPVAVLDLPPVVVVPSGAAKLNIEALPSKRLAEPYEQLRDRSDRTLAATGARPKIFLANLGTLADFSDRATFAKNFFATGGIEAVTNEASPEPDDLASAFRASGAALACLCSSDKVYATQAADAARALSAAGARHLYLAGRPRDLEGALRQAGVQDFIYLGCDALKILGEVHARLKLE